MTAICGGGPSGPKSGFQKVVTVGSAALGTWFTRAAPRNTGAIIAAALAGASFDLTDFCTRDPPPDPGVTPNDVLALLNVFDTAAGLAANQKFLNWFGSQYWYDVCDCTGTPTPTRPTPSNPGDSDLNPQLPTGGTTIPCWSIERSYREATDQTHSINHTDTDLPLTPTVTVNAPSAPPFNIARTIPPGTTSFNLAGRVEAFTSNTTAAVAYMQLYNAAGDQLEQIVFFDSNGLASSFGPSSIPLPGTATSWQILFGGGAPGPVPWQYSLNFFCQGAGPSQVQTPCCPPDPSIDLRLRTIYELLANLTINGGGSAPINRYVKGTVHSALTGTLSLPVSDILGVLVDVTQGTPTTPQLGGNPPYEWDLGFLTILTGDGMIEQRRLTRQHQVWLPQQGPFATVVGVFLNPGVVVNLTELLPP